VSGDNPVLQAAIRYGRQGVHVLPIWPRRPDGICTCREGLGPLAGANCDSPGKHPKNTKHGWKDATTNGRTIRGWFEVEPVPWLGAVAHLSGLAFLDIDPRNGGTIPEGLPETRVERTPSGGWHYWFRADPTRRLPGKAGPGIDILHRGRYIVTAPTPGYELVSTAPIADWPEHVAEYVEPGRISGGCGGEDDVSERFEVRCAVVKGGQERTPSLQISRTTEGLTLVTCFAGCAVEDVLAAWNVDFESLFPESDPVDFVMTDDDVIDLIEMQLIREVGLR
jgi:hypothetical protein